MGVFFGPTEITGIHFGEQEITEIFFGNTEIFSVWAEYDGTLPAQYSANGDYLADYRIYGSAGGAGDDSGTAYGYEVDMSVASNNLIDCESGWQSRFGDGTYTGDNMTGTLMITARNWFWKIFKVKPNTNYIFNGRCTDYSLSVGYGCYGSNSGVIDATDAIFSSFAASLPNFVFNSGNRDEIALCLYCGSTTAGTSTYTNLRISEGTGTNFIPYSNTTTPIYIGSDPLGEDEYVDYGEGKIYRMSGGVLTPTNPPVPLPALSTVDGTNIVDYAGQSAAVPSRFYAKYRKEGF